MNCYEWRHNISLSGMSLSVQCSYQIPAPDGRLLDVNISGMHTYPDVSGPYPKKAMRCGINSWSPYGKWYALRAGYKSYDRFLITTWVQSNEWDPITVTVTDENPRKATIFTQQGAFPSFISGLFKPENSDDPAYTCAYGIWSKSKEVTKGGLYVQDQFGELLVNGRWDRIQNGAEINYFRPDDPETSVGTGVMTYVLQ